MQKAVATYLVDPNKLFREGLKKLLTETRFEIVGESADASNLTDGRAGTRGETFSSTLCSRPVSRFQMRMLLSSDPLTSRLPSGEKEMD